MPRMVEQKIRSAVPLYLAAGAFLAASALLPIYQWWAIVLAGVLAALGLVLVGAGAGPTLLLTAAWLCSNLIREAGFEGKRKPLRRRKRRRGETA